METDQKPLGTPSIPGRASCHPVPISRRCKSRSLVPARRGIHVDQRRFPLPLNLNLNLNPNPNLSSPDKTGQNETIFKSQKTEPLPPSYLRHGGYHSSHSGLLRFFAF